MKRILVILSLVAGITRAEAQCSDLFISEYVEGSSFNKVIELYNPSPAAITLNGYQLQLWPNGGTSALVNFNLNGILNSGDVYVIAHGSADAALLAIADTVSSSVINFNGDDAIILLNSGGDTLDCIGEWGVDPAGSSWTVGSGSTENHSLVRMAGIQQGNRDWAVVSTQWDVYPSNEFSYTGSHTMISCGPITDTIISFSYPSLSVVENSGTASINVKLNQVAAVDVQVAVILTSGFSADLGGFVADTLILTAGSLSTGLSIPISDDLIIDGDQSFTFALRNVQPAYIIMGSDSLCSLVVRDNEHPAAVQYPIAQINGLDSSGFPDSIGLRCEISGKVYGVNLNSSGLYFFLHDSTAGIAVYNPANDFGYGVSEGDEVTLIGEVGFYAGLTQMINLDTVYVSGHSSIPLPTAVVEMDETTEAELIRLPDCLALEDATAWDNSNPSGFTVQFTDGTNSYDVRIDNNVDIYSSFATPSTGQRFTISGIGGQYDNSNPYDEGYQIVPRYVADMEYCLSIDEMNVNGGVMVQPNPVSNRMHFSMNEKKEIRSAWIFDQSGKQVYQLSRKEIENQELHLSKWSSGIYFLQLQGEGFTQHAEFIIQ